MTVFDFNDYRKYLNFSIKNRPQRGRGEINKMAEFIEVHPSLLSQILSTEKNLSSDQGFKLCEYLGFSQNETDYFLLLIQYDRAANHKLKKYYLEKINLAKENSLQLSQKIKQDKKITDVEKSILYSHWLYLAIWLYCSIEPGKKIEAITEHFEITRDRAFEILNFLLSIGLCDFRDGLYIMKSQSVHLEKGSPHLYRHHNNWRIKAIETTDKITNEELMYTAPMSISRKDFATIRQQLADTIKTVTDTAIESEAEDLVYFGIDLFWVRK